MPPILNVIAMATFAASLSARALDPLLPHIADEFSVSIATAAGLSAGFAFTFAMMQPVLGAAADMFGKARLMLVCLVLLGLSNLLGAIATSYSLLFAARVLAGIAAGGIFPTAMGLVSDVVASDKRQLGLSRTLAGAMTGNLLGASLSGVVGDLVGWRGVLTGLGVTMLAASAAVGLGFSRRGDVASPTPMSFATLRAGYRTIFSNRNSWVCFPAVFLEGTAVFGLFPFVAAMLFDLGETRLSIAGLVIAGFAVGGLFYTFSVSRFLPVLGVRGMIIGGAAIAASMLLCLATGPSWPVQFGVLLLMGWGFYMIHGSLQVFASELTAEARASAMALHSFFFFMGQTAGPLADGFSLPRAGKVPTLLAAAATFALLGIACAVLLRQRPPADAPLIPDRDTAERPDPAATPL
jgi:predicted MFS family arabinose efflux permease